MTTVLDQDVGSILDSYADAIEGGNSWRGSGTVFKGIPGRYPSDKGLREGTDDTLTVKGSSVSTTTFDVAADLWGAQDRWVSTKGPPFFVVTPDNEIRKVTGYAPSTALFTVAPALSAELSADDELSVYQGFKRVPNLADIEADAPVGLPEGWDRFFHLRALPGAELRRYGDGYKLYRTVLELRLRLCKHARMHDWTAAVMTNLMIIRSVITRAELYPTYVKALFSAEDQQAEVEHEDDQKIVVVDRYALVYRVDATYA